MCCSPFSVAQRLNVRFLYQLEHTFRQFIVFISEQQARLSAYGELLYLPDRLPFLCDIHNALVSSTKDKYPG